MSLNLNSNKSFKYYRKLEGSVIYISKWSSGGIDYIFFMSHRLSPCVIITYYQVCKNLISSWDTCSVIILPGLPNSRPV